MSELRTLQDLMIEETRDLYHAEKQITQALPKMIAAASDPQLKQSFQAHLTETEGQIKRLEQVFQLLEIPVKAKVCHAMLMPSWRTLKAWWLAAVLVMATRWVQA